MASHVTSSRSPPLSKGYSGRGQHIGHMTSVRISAPAAVALR